MEAQTLENRGLEAVKSSPEPLGPPPDSGGTVGGWSKCGKIRQNAQLGSKVEAQEALKSRREPEKIDVEKQQIVSLDFATVRTLFRKGFG